jgi:hypothetical protein
MNLAECTFEGCRIYAAAKDIPGSSGFHAAVVVMDGWRQGVARSELFRDECLQDGRVWLDPQGALAFALEAGQSAILAQRALLRHGSICITSAASAVVARYPA